MAHPVHIYLETHGFWAWIRDAILARKSPKNRPAKHVAADQDSREHRDLVLEMMRENPDAFRSELDVQTMARLYRSRH
jgi:hypothetical protein